MFSQGVYKKLQRPKIVSRGRIRYFGGYFKDDKGQKRLKKRLPLLGFEPGSSASKSRRVTITPHGNTYEIVSKSTNISCYHTLVTKVLK